ncbi:MAG: sigma 54-interacting transcriptional regulator [Bacillota bacterium]|nr:sigma 54-interacting transcriptional regulator [Bacillota bacterium]
MDNLSLRKSLEEAWNIFITTGKISSSIRPIIAESWQRCYDNQVSPYTNKIFRSKLSEEEIEKHYNLLRIAVPIMKNFYNFVKGSFFLISLANNKGVYIAIEGDINIINKTRVRLGDNWTEESAGTNSIGLCLLTNKPTQVFAAEHFCKTGHDWAASSAPIFDENNDLLGVLTMVGDYDKVHPHTLGMIVASANAIENSLRIAIADAFKTLMMESISDGILALKIDRTIMHINKSAKNLLKITKPENEILSQPINNLLGKDHLLYKGIENCFEQKNANFSLEADDYTANYKLIYSPNKEIIGLLLVLREMKKIKQFVNRFVGARATYTFEDLIGQNDQFLSTVTLGKTASNSISNVLLVGESGTGKEIFAQAIHNSSNRKNNPFLAINCAALPRNLIESELFGYADGAFTGAKKGGNPGKFELADGGTLFLDEIGEMPLEFQAVLLRVLQENSITRIGGRKLIPIDVRIIAATNKNLEEEIKLGHFRSDLYYRLNVLKINIPPLRERPDDIVFLAEHFLKKLNQRLNKNVSQISKDALDVLTNYHWPGNARELQNVLERTINIVIGNIITASNLPASIRKTVEEKDEPTLVPLENYEKELIASLLSKNNGNKTKVAKFLGISRTTLYRKISEYCID